jgi:glycosyltransferase involved in cell wall biosynthesis
LERDEVPAGPLHIHGLAEAPGGVATVEVFRDGDDVGLARTCLPGRLPNVDQGPESATAMFQAMVIVPADRDEVTFTARVTPCVGDAFDLAPWTAKVRSPEPDLASPERLALVRDRSAGVVEGVRSDQVAADASRLRVLVITHDLSLGGGQLYLQELLKRLAPLGIECCVASLRGGRLTDELEALGFPVLVTGPFDVHDAEAYEAHVRQVMEFAVRHGCEVALANTMTVYAGVDAAQRVGLGVVWAIHESFSFAQFWGEAHHPPFPTYAADRTRAALAATRRAVFEAAATLDLYAPNLGQGVGTVVPYGVDFDEIDEYRRRVDRDRLREELGIAASTTVLLVVGTVEPRKAQLNIVQAFAGSTALRDQDVSLVFVGAKQGSPHTEQLEDLVELYGDPRVRIEPIQPDVYRWYHACDVLVCGSDVESLPRTMLEAMAFERPVASTAVFGIPELLSEGVDGFLCRARDQLALREMLGRVSSTPRSELAAMGARARAKVLQRHDPEIYTRFFYDELHRVAGRTPPGTVRP